MWLYIRLTWVIIVIVPRLYNRSEWQTNVSPFCVIAIGPAAQQLLCFPENLFCLIKVASAYSPNQWHSSFWNLLAVSIFRILQSLQHTFCYTYDIINVACRCGLYNVHMIFIIIVLSWNEQCPHLTFSEGKSDHRTTIFQGCIDVTVTVRMNLVSFL